MFDIILKYIELGELLAIIISIIELWISIHVWMKDKPILYVEKHSSHFDNDGKSTIFIFYLNNTGKQPTTIKEIEFSTEWGFKPNDALFEISKDSIPNTAGHGVYRHNIVGLKIPFQLMPQSSKVIKAVLDFSFNEELKRQHKTDEIHYNIKIKHTDKKIFEAFI